MVARAQPWRLIRISMQVHGLTRFALLKPNLNLILPKNAPINPNLIGAIYRAMVVGGCWYVAGKRGLTWMNRWTVGRWVIMVVEDRWSGL
ncbi:hypothetical protein V6N12_059851 [Hibiscus sabdariffa]|uniref:Uncharacterized protein n=1 Tax=Hibiscus sabdariffa TaxID=183260 RepID=A0ABR2BCI7_9ROSI